jgi:hypothetical protein
MRFEAIMEMVMELMTPSLRTLIVLLGSEKCVQNFGEEIFWKTSIWKTCKGWKNNIMKDFRTMDYEDSTSMEKKYVKSSRGFSY